MRRNRCTNTRHDPRSEVRRFLSTSVGTHRRTARRAQRRAARSYLCHARLHVKDQVEVRENKHTARSTQSSKKHKEEQTNKANAIPDQETSRQESPGLGPKPGSNKGERGPTQDAFALPLATRIRLHGVTSESRQVAQRNRKCTKPEKGNQHKWSSRAIEKILQGSTESKNWAR